LTGPPGTVSCVRLPGVDPVEVEWVTHGEERQAHAVMWRSAEGPPWQYGIVCGHLSGASGWRPAARGAPRCTACRLGLPQPGSVP